MSETTAEPARPATTDERRSNGYGPAPVGRALEPRYYLGEDALRREMDTVFARSWQYAGHVGELAEPNTYITTRAGDQPVLVVRTEDGELRAYRNVCRHRGSELLTGDGKCKRAIRCRYHGWTYDSTDGRLMGVPEHRNYAELDKSKLGLMPARVETLAGFVFVNLDPEARPLAELTRGSASGSSAIGSPSLRSSGPRARGGSQPANWKIVVENYLEGYHVPIAHPGLMRLYDYQRYSAEIHEHWAWFEAPLRETPSSNRMERLYQRLAKPMTGPRRGRPHRLALHRHLSQHRDRPLPRPGQRLADPPGRPRLDRRPLGLLPRAQPGAGRRGWCSASTSASTPRSWTRTSTW